MHETAVELQFAKGNALKLLHGRIPGAEIIDGKLEPFQAQSGQDIHGDFQVGEDRGFGDFQDQVLRRKIDLLDAVQDEFRQIDVGQPVGRQIEGNRESKARLGQSDAILQGVGKEHLGQGRDHAMALGRADEEVGRTGRPSRCQRASASNPTTRSVLASTLGWKCMLNS